ncbi:MAG: hypothetical protein HYZ37_15790 [Candidatus Solibacter usitatus]|nr:hypothetical protein [Candidatus Solibacter usitatus]
MRLAAALLFLAWRVNAASALLETRGEAHVGQIHFFDFRPDSARGWNVRRASLLLHIQSGAVPKFVDLRAAGRKWNESDAAGSVKGLEKRRRFRVTSVEKNWIRVEVDPKWIERMADGTAFGIAIEEKTTRFDGRRPVQSAPYLLVEGSPRR